MNKTTIIIISIYFINFLHFFSLYLYSNSIIILILVTLPTFGVSF